MNADIAYCDYNATTPVRPEAAEAVTRALAIGGNPSSVHAAGRAAKALLENAREAVAKGVGARARDVIFTGGATEALQLALEAARDTYDDLIISEIEHDALWEATATMDEMSPLRVDGDGLVDLGHLGDLLAAASHPLVAVMLANNETGVVQPVAQVAARVREAGGLLLVDASQAVGRIPVDIGVLDASYLVMSSHKTGGPPGAGALVQGRRSPSRVVAGGRNRDAGRGQRTSLRLRASVQPWKLPRPSKPRGCNSCASFSRSGCGGTMRTWSFSVRRRRVCQIHRFSHSRARPRSWRSSPLISKASRSVPVQPARQAR
ncbi:MAG: cysteine desulfurase [Alphaproteobacteria bacterium]|nr:MAG: cysteine desulfurase [Alphaproteobacteria bacterium]